MPSTSDLSGLPAPAMLRRALQLSAKLDIVLCDDQWLRCYDFQPKWSKGVSLAKYDSGGGDDLFVFFRGDDAIIKGFDHESPVSRHARDDYAVWPGIYEDVPPALDALLDDDAVQRDDVTFCIWHASGKWHCGSMRFPEEEDDGSNYLLGAIHLTTAAYLEWAEDYYERDLDAAAVEAVYSGQAIDAALVAALNPERKVKSALAELAKMADA